MYYPKPFSVRSKLITNAARGERCTLRLPGYCNGRVDTTVACHLPGHNKGVGKKVNDLHIAFACSACHDIIDGRFRSHHLNGGVILDACLRGLSETQHRLVELGFIVIPDFEHPSIQPIAITAI